MSLPETACNKVACLVANVKALPANRRMMYNEADTHKDFVLLPIVD